ncbi:MAG TPA: exonuclease domain-containing protein, partial [Actinomycetota bacterium]|nr:exonuclease domain-containing protein [Actinomycetota bacterium]
MLPHQTSFDDLGAALSEVTFVALDLETTGGSPASCAITEVGAVKMRGGDVLGTFQTLVDPGVPIPRFITHLTGIDDWTVRAAPPLEAVLPSLVEFVAGSVLVA